MTTKVAKNKEAPKQQPNPVDTWESLREKIEARLTNPALRTLSRLAASDDLREAWSDGYSIFFDFNDPEDLEWTLRSLKDEKITVCFRGNTITGNVVWHHGIKDDDAETWYIVHVMIGLAIRLKADAPA